MKIADFKTELETAALLTDAVAFTFGLNEELNKAGTLFPHLRYYPEQWVTGRRGDYVKIANAKFYVYGYPGVSRETAWDNLVAIWDEFVTQLSGASGGKVEITSPNNPINLFLPGQTVEQVYCIEIKATLKLYC